MRALFMAQEGRAEVARGQGVAARRTFCTLRHGRGVDEPVAKPLVISFCMIVRAEFTDGPVERLLPEEDHASKTVFLDRPHKALRNGIAIRRSWWDLHQRDTVVEEHGLEFGGELRISIDDEVRHPGEETVIERDEMTFGQSPSATIHF